MFGRCISTQRRRLYAFPRPGWGKFRGRNRVVWIGKVINSRWFGVAWGNGQGVSSTHPTKGNVILPATESALQPL